MRKQLLLFICIFCVLGSAQAQIILGPPSATGNAGTLSISSGWSTMHILGCHQSLYTITNVYTTPEYGDTLAANSFASLFSTGVQCTIHCSLDLMYSSMLYGMCNGFQILHHNVSTILEFDIADLSGLGVTQENFQSATLSGIEIAHSDSVGQNVSLGIFDLNDFSEDGLITENDRFFSSSPLSDIFSSIPPIGTVINDIDVTSALYNDLFGAGVGQDYSGFALSKTSGSNGFQIFFDRNCITLTITTGDPVPSLSMIGIVLLIFIITLYAILKLRNKPITILIFFSVFVTATAYADVPWIEMQALQAFYNSTDGDNWNNNTNWLVGDPCLNNWYGIVCNFDGTIAELYNFHNNNLNGEIPSEIGNLSKLRHIFAPNNHLTSIPQTIGNCTLLEYLDLDNNQITNLPASIGNLDILYRLELSDNQISGTIPTEIGNMNNLHRLYLSDNRLSGTIPTEIGNLSELYHLRVDGNMLEGPLPDEMLNLTNLNDDYSDFRFNALYSDNATLRAFLNTKQTGYIDWELTQTTAPENCSVMLSGSNTFLLNWTTIPYFKDAGGYEVHYSFTSGGPYSFLAYTDDKLYSSMWTHGLTPNTTYYLVVRTVTFPHGGNQNTVQSNYSGEFIGNTAPAVPALDTIGIFLILCLISMIFLNHKESTTNKSRIEVK